MAGFTRDPWILIPYRTYSGKHHLYIRGRALEDQPLKLFEQQTLYQTIRNTWRTFKTDEIRNALVILTLPNGNFFETKADHEMPCLHIPSPRESLLRPCTASLLPATNHCASCSMLKWHQGHLLWCLWVASNPIAAFLLVYA